jgi:hypothetical protein
MFLETQTLYKFSLILRTPNVHLAVASTTEIITKQETIQTKQNFNIKVDYKNCRLPSRNNNKSKKRKTSMKYKNCSTKQTIHPAIPKAKKIKVT